MASDDDTQRGTPWGAVGIGAGVGLVGLVLALAVAAPVVVLGLLALLGVTGWLAWVVGRRGWDTTSTPRQLPDPAAVEALADAYRSRARDRHAVTVAAVAAGLVPPGLGEVPEG